MKTQKTFISRDVIFVETKFPFLSKMNIKSVTWTTGDSIHISSWLVQNMNVSTSLVSSSHTLVSKINSPIIETQFAPVVPYIDQIYSSGHSPDVSAN